MSSVSQREFSKWLKAMHNRDETIREHVNSLVKSFNAMHKRLDELDRRLTVLECNTCENTK